MSEFKRGDRVRCVSPGSIHNNRVGWVDSVRTDELGYVYVKVFFQFKDYHTTDPGKLELCADQSPINWRW